MSRSSTHLIVAAAAAALAGGFSSSAFAQTSAVQSGNWSDSATWSAGEPEAATPTPALIDQGFTVTIDQFGETTNLVDLGTAADQTGHLRITGGDLTVSKPGEGLASIRVGQALGGTGTLTMSGGTVAINGAFGSGFADGELMVGDVGNGTMTMTGGSLIANDEIVIGAQSTATGVVDISGGSFEAAGRSILVGFAGDGTLDVSGTAAVRANFDMLVGFIEGSTGAVNQSGGTIEAGFLFTNSFTGGAGSTVTMNQTGGTYNARIAYVLGQGIGTTTMDHSGGTINVLGDGAMVVSDGGGNTSTYNISDSAAVNLNADLFVGAFGGSNGTINQTGGTINAERGIFSIGRGGLGAWNQQGGTNTAANVFLGDFDNTTGTYRISGGALNVIGNMSVGGALASNAPPAPVGTEGQALNADGTLIVSGSGGTINVGGNFLANGGDNARVGPGGESNTSTLVFEFLDASGTSLVDVGGLADLTGAIVDIDEMGYTFAEGDVFKLLNAADISEDFVVAAEDVGRFNVFVAPDAALGGETLYATLVPEPTSLALLGIGGLALLGRRRRHA